MKTQLSVTLRLMLSLSIAATFASCQEEEFFEKDFSQNMGVEAYDVELPKSEVIIVEADVEISQPIPPTAIPPVLVTPNNCETISHGETIARVQYKMSSVLFGHFCNEETQTSTCSDGVLSTWTGTYSFNSCAILSPENCNDIIHGGVETRVMYQSSKVAYGSSCSSQAQTRACNNGALTSWSGNFENIKCVVTSPSVNQVTENFTQKSTTKGKVDILWMVDNSGSMGDEQAELAYNFDLFINDFLKEEVSFKMGITTTDLRSNYSGVSRCSFDKLTDQAAKSNESQFIADFKECIKVGTNGYYKEAGLQTSTDFLKRYGASFLRDDAYLIVVMISDEREQSSSSVSSYIEQLKSRKNNPGLVKVYSIVNVNTAPRYIEAADSTGGRKADIKGDFADILKKMGEKIVDLSSSFALKSLPYDDEIIVTVDGKTITSGWVIDTESGTLKFEDGSIPPEGAAITIRYNAMVK
ncbi:MAG: VWA domain-containing protein [Bacteriovoracaceae bacterium]|nr:VWA domain-containing protein [Bacteriovoracaceae bacterium]